MAAPAKKDSTMTIDDMAPLTNKELVITIDDPLALPEKAYCRMPVPSEHSAPKGMDPLDQFNLKARIEREKAMKKGKLFWTLLAVCFMIAFFVTLLVLKVH